MSGEGNWYEQVKETVNSMGEEIDVIKRFQQECERDKKVGMLMQLNEKLMTQATNYTNLILVAGYAGFFGLWSSLITKLPNWLYALSGLFALLSLILFVSWEIIKMIWGNRYMNRTNKMITEVARGPDVLDMFISAYSLHSVKAQKVWVWFLIPTMTFGMLAALLLVGFFVLQIWKSLH